MWKLPGPRIEPVSPALAGGFSTTDPPGKSPGIVFTLCLFPRFCKNPWRWSSPSLMGVFPFCFSLSLLGFSFHFLHQAFHLYELPFFFFFFLVLLLLLFLVVWLILGCFLFVCFLATLLSMLDLSSPTRDQTRTTCTGITKS